MSLGNQRPAFIKALDQDFALLEQKREQSPKLSKEYDYLDRLVLKLEAAETFEMLQMTAISVANQINKMKMQIMKTNNLGEL